MLTTVPTVPANPVGGPGYGLTATVLVWAELFVTFGFAPKMAAASQKLQDAVVCAVVGRQYPPL
jgi:hypothetical protein